MLEAGAQPSRRSSLLWTLVPVILAVPLSLWLILVAAWAADGIATSGRAPRGTAVAGQATGGLTPRRLREVVDEVATSFERRRVLVVAGGTSREVRLEDLGVEVDRDATSRNVMSARAEGHPLAAPVLTAVDRLTGSHEQRNVPMAVTIDGDHALAAIGRIAASASRPPTEPRITRTSSGFAVKPGSPGTGYSAEGGVRRLRSLLAAPTTDHPSRLPRLRVELDPVEVPPKTDESALRRLADRLRSWTDRPLLVRVADHQATAAPEVTRTWWRIRHDPNRPEAVFAADVARGWLEDAFAAVRVEPVDATMTVTPFGIVVGESRTGRACCEDGWEEELRRALQEGVDEVTLRARVLRPRLDSERARTLGVKEPIASFTTSYTPGQPRVTNIHRIAELVRGVVILPGEKFSLNDHVGPRTAADGFVDAPVIYRGRFRSDVGGGVSQFATTLFNAAFFGGLDFGEYQSHSIYISRYPYGREATVSYPHPDLEIVNSTPYGVLIWTETTPSTVTVTLWSTKYWEVEQSGQRREPSGR
ncbi:MAG: hypothetical protein KatS3mg008_0753 [Acidimicrobiales bacterium]|nr:MAG: hypothetical protein KatS3mg008_0753 [Acidimicrobiales bacterium]